MTPTPNRIGRILAAGALGALRWAAIMTLLVVAGIPVVLLGTQWYARGTLEVLPVVGSAHRSQGDRIAIRGASAHQARTITGALADLRYPVSLTQVSIVVSDELCPDCSGDYQPDLRVIRIDRAVVDVGGLPLQQALSHEIGHHVDMTHLTDRTRSEFRALRRIPSDLSWEAPERPWRMRPVEDFAEVFSVLDMPLVAVAPRTAYGPVSQTRRLRAVLAQAGVGGQAEGPVDWRRTLVLELELLRSLASDPAFMAPAVSVVIMGSALGGLAAMLRA